MTRRKKKGDCYENAANAVLFGLSGIGALRRPEQLTLVHGQPRYKGEPAYEGKRLVQSGDRYGHAWVESGGMVFDVTTSMMPYPFKAERYYELGDIDPAQCQRYTQDEVREMVLEHEHYGPWRTKVVA